MIKITDGKWKGQSLTVPSKNVRPTSSMLREALFNIFGGRIEHARVLDWFAGSGSIGFEALSRGAQEVCFVESQPVVIRIINENIKKLNCSKETQIFKFEFENAIQNLGRYAPFDLVFADPPYSCGWERRLIEEVSWEKLLSISGLFFLESRWDPKKNWDNGGSTLAELKGLALIRDKKYGDKRLQTFQLKQ